MTGARNAQRVTVREQRMQGPRELGSPDRRVSRLACLVTDGAAVSGGAS